MTAEEFIGKHMFTYNPENPNKDKYIGINQSYFEEALKDFAKIKVKEVLEIVAKKAKTQRTANTGSWLDASIDKNSILNCINLDEFIK